MGNLMNVAQATKIVKDTYDTLTHSGFGFNNIIVDRFILDISTTPLKITVKFFAGNTPISEFTLIEQPNCCAIMISTRTFVYEPYRGKGVAQEMLELKESIAKAFGYSMLLSTVNITGNPTEVHILEKSGWIKNSEVVNKRTKNLVGIFTKILS